MAAKSIVIGANGYIGRNLAWHLEKKGDEVLGYGHSQLDISDQASVDELDTNVDFIYWFAGLAGTAQGFDDFNAYIDINEKGLLNLLTAMRRQRSKARLVFPSTRLVYKGQRGLALKEGDEKEAKTLYAVNKLACEQILQMYRNVYELNYTVFRICVPYGNLLQGRLSYGTLGFFLEKAMAGQNISLYGDGTLRRTFTHVGDICEKIRAAATLDESNGQIYNVGGEDLSLLDVARQIALKYGVGVDFAEWPEMDWKIESGDTVFDSTKLEKLTGSTYGNTISGWL
jgi:UDP-glucose 4-epimerase